MEWIKVNYRGILSFRNILCHYYKRIEHTIQKKININYLFVHTKINVHVNTTHNQTLTMWNRKG